MTETLHAKVLIVGGGPGGYVAAIRAGQLGLEPVLVEADRLGGTCLIRGCIPSKALIHAAERFEATRRYSQGGSALGIDVGAAPTIDLSRTLAWKNGIVGRLEGGVAALLKRAGARVLAGRAVFSDAKTCQVASAEGEIRITAESVVLATGSLPVELPNLPFGGPVISSSEALDLPAAPERLAVVGAGYIGLELGSAFAKIGSHVEVVEALDRILPQFDAELAAPVAKSLQRMGIKVHLKARAKGLAKGGKGHRLLFE
ncbi:MAG: FAD-dependent oxidoreductase, partial [Caulobacteraceae bacterium]